MTTTIAAIASPPGGGVRGVIRLSGPRTSEIIARATTPADPTDPFPPLRRAALEATFHDPRGDQPALLLWMPGPRSYTREDVAELHLPGPPPLLAAALERLLALGACAAAPGEFTRRAFLNGRIDLVQAEGVLELVCATNEAERRSALPLLEGGLSRRVAGLRDGLEELRSLAEASLDFDETDAGHVGDEELEERLAAVEVDLRRALLWEVRRQSPSALPRIALAGPPNAGKSALFNALVPSGRAIVADLPGTTRDPIVGLWSVAGVECLLVDAPGFDPDAGGADRVAQGLAEGERRGAEVVLLLADASAGPGGLAVEPPPDPRILRLWSKVDAAPDLRAELAEFDGLAVSALTGAGLGELEERVARRLGLAGDPDAAAEMPPTGPVRELSARHRHALERALGELVRARSMHAGGVPLDLVAEALRAATDALDLVCGRTTPEDLLDRIFARFCLGK